MIEGTMVTDVSASLSWSVSAVLMFCACFYDRFKFQHYFRVSPVAKMIRTQVWWSCRESSSPSCSTSFGKQDCMACSHISSAPPSLVVWRRRRRRRRRKRRSRRKSPSEDPRSSRKGMGKNKEKLVNKFFVIMGGFCKICTNVAFFFIFDINIYCQDKTLYYVWFFWHMLAIVCCLVTKRYMEHYVLEQKHIYYVWNNVPFGTKSGAICIHKRGNEDQTHGMGLGTLSKGMGMMGSWPKWDMGPSTYLMT